MNLPALVNHGLTSLAVHTDIAGTRILLAMALLSFLIGLATTLTFSLRLFTNILLVGQAS
jgi:F0F1-type ATP synthase membrane subunit a